MKKWMSLVLAIAMMLSLAACANGSPDTNSEDNPGTSDNSPYADAVREPRDLHWASGNSSGSGYITGSIMSGLLPDYYDGYLVIPEVTTGGVANAQMLLDGQGDFITMQSDDAIALNTNQRAWVDNAACTDKLRMVGVSSQTYFQMFANADDDSINHFKDLKGKRIGVLAGSTRAYALQYLLQINDMTEADFKEVHEMGRSDLASAFQNGMIDFILDVTPTGNSTYQEMAFSGKGIKMLSLTDEEIAAMQELNPAYMEGTIAADTYTNVPEVKTLTFYNLLLTYKEMPDYVVYDVLKCLCEHDADLKAAHPSAGVDQDAAVLQSNLFEDVPLHPGAEAYYKEIGMLA